MGYENEEILYGRDTVLWFRIPEGAQPDAPENTDPDGTFKLYDTDGTTLLATLDVTADRDAWDVDDSGPGQANPRLLTLAKQDKGADITDIILRRLYQLHQDGVSDELISAVRVVETGIITPRDIPWDYAGDSSPTLYSAWLSVTVPAATFTDVTQMAENYQGRWIYLIDKVEHTEQVEYDVVRFGTSIPPLTPDDAVRRMSDLDTLIQRRGIDLTDKIAMAWDSVKHAAFGLGRDMRLVRNQSAFLDAVFYQLLENLRLDGIYPPSAAMDLAAWDKQVAMRRQGYLNSACQAASWYDINNDNIVSVNEQRLSGAWVMER